MTLYTFAGKVVMDMEVKGIIIEGAQIGLEAIHHPLRSGVYLPKRRSH